MKLWQESAQKAPEKVQPWLLNKYPNYSIKQIEDTGIARWLPPKDRPEWFPWYHPYMVMLAFDHHGLVQSIHGRIMGDPPPDKPKSRFPKGYSASGLVLGNKTGVNWLRGKQTVERVLIAEGLTSTLAAAMALKHKWAVFGYTSGSSSCIEQMPWSGQQVVILTDNDKAGDAYAEKVLQVLPPNINVKRGNLNGG
jgi:DNA primase